MDEQIASLQAIIRHMVAASGLTYAEVSRAMGRNDRYIAVMLSEGRTPSLDLFVKIADACGYHVELKGWGDLESWELGVEDGALVATKDYGPEDMPELSRMEADMREALRDMGRRELLDELIAQLQQMRNATE